MAAVEETPSLTGEFVGETHRVLECTQTHPLRNQHQKGPICLGVVREVTESWQRAKQVVLFPLGTLPHIQHHNAAKWLPHPGEHLSSAPYNVTAVLRQKSMALMKEQIKTRKIELSIEETANLSDAEFKTLVIRMLTEMVQYGWKIEEKMKAMKSQIKEYVQGTKSEGKETGTQINDLEEKEERNIQPEQNEETRIQKNEERLRNLQDNFKHSNIWIIGCQKEKRGSKKLKSYLNK